MNTVNDVFHDEATLAEDMTISMEMILDRSSYEIFVDEGKLTLIDSFENDASAGFKFETQPSGIKIKELDVHKLKSAW